MWLTFTKEEETMSQGTWTVPEAGTGKEAFFPRASRNKIQPH